MNRPSLPLGAATPDEVLAAAQDPGLTDAQRRDVEAWLVANPEWRLRARSYVAIRAAIRALGAVDTAPPAIASMGGLWAAIDEHRRTTTAPGRALAPPSPPAPPSLDVARARRRSPGWLLAAAALLVVAVGAVVAVGSSDDTAEDATEDATEDVTAADPDDPPVTSAPSVGDAPGADVAATPDNEVTALAQLREGADRTADITAEIVFRSLATADVSDGEIGELTGEDVVYFETVGRGELALPDRSLLATSTVTRVGDRTDLFPELVGVTVTNGERTFVRCEGEADYVETTDQDDTECFATGVSPDTFGPEAALDAIQQESFASGGITRLGTDTMSDGTVITGYQTTEPVTLDAGETVQVTMQIWLDDDQYIRRVVSGADFSAGDAGYPTNLVLSYELFDIGTEVDIPELD